MNKYLKGILGGMIGGLIASIPWVLMYVYGNLILEVLSVVVALGVLKGYQFFHGEEDEKLPIFVASISILSITIATFVMIPTLLMLKEKVPVSIKTFQYLFSNREFFSALIRDYIISFLFTVLGISGIVQNIKKQIEDGETENIKGLSSKTTMLNPNEENIELFREAFIKLNALDKEHAVLKEEILDEVENPNAVMLFKNLRMQQIIAKYKGKYYFKEKYADSTLKRFLKIYFKIIGIILLFALFILLIVL